MFIARIIALLFALLALAGCTDEDAPVDAASVPIPEVIAVQLPENITVSQDFIFGQDLAQTWGVLPPCGATGTPCDVYPFLIPETGSRTIQVEANLVWSQPVNDLELYLVNDGQIVNQSMGFIGDFERVVDTLAPGDYEFWVGYYVAAADTYTLEVGFSYYDPEPVQWPDQESSAAGASPSA